MANPDKHRSRSREAMFKYNLRKLYGMTVDEYDDLLALQGDRCAICNEPFTKRPNVDHDHVTSRVRGLLCGECNRGLGAFADCLDLLRAAVRYIERHG